MVPMPHSAFYTHQEVQLLWTSLFLAAKAERNKIALLSIASSSCDHAAFTSCRYKNEGAANPERYLIMKQLAPKSHHVILKP